MTLFHKYTQTCGLSVRELKGTRPSMLLQVIKTASKNYSIFFFKEEKKKDTHMDMDFFFS